MMRTVRFAAVMSAAVLGLLCYTSCAKDEPDPAATAAQARANNRFAAALHAQLRETEGNLFYSPYSIRTALAMTYAGARGDTARQMRDALALNVPDEKLNAGLAALTRRVSSGGSGEFAFQLHVANSLWGQRGCAFEEDFLDLVGDSYGAGLREVDFAGDAEGAREAINEWVEEATRDKIKDLVREGDLSPLTRLVLANAIYFKADWVHMFYESQTRDEDFRVSADRTVQAPTMHQVETYAYAESEDWRMLGMPFFGGKSMVVVLPREADGLPQVEKALAEVLGQGVFAGEAGSKSVSVSLPKFKFRWRDELTDELTSLGMGDAFEAGRADFSGISAQERLFVSRVLHQAFIDVHEKGAEAAAATEWAATAEDIREPVEFRVDHPFLFAIRDDATGAILFMGRVVDPTK